MLSMYHAVTCSEASPFECVNHTRQITFIVDTDRTLSVPHHYFTHSSLRFLLGARSVTCAKSEPRLFLVSVISSQVWSKHLLYLSHSILKPQCLCGGG